jgi:hypothetical protein
MTAICASGLAQFANADCVAIALALTGQDLAGFPIMVSSCITDRRPVAKPYGPALLFSLGISRCVVAVANSFELRCLFSLHHHARQEIYVYFPFF